MSEADQWTVVCPKCKARDRLFVVEVQHPVSGKTYHPDTKLEPDGFLFDPKGFKDASTEEEKVRCQACGAAFELGELTVGILPSV